jgi:sialate O-acetylesterase
MRAGFWFGCVVILVVSSMSASVRAEVSAACIFTDSMVLQRDKPVPIWGKGAPGEAVTVEFLDQKVTTKTGEDGRWKVALKPLATDDKGHELTVSGPDKKIVFKDVLVGEVWLCAGQSNMVWQVRNCANAKEEIAAANYPKMRVFQVGYAKADDHGYSIDPSLLVKSYALRPQDKCNGYWVPSNPTNAGAFSGMAYYFGRDLHKELNVPVGLIVSAVGATAIEAWMSVDQLKDIPAYHNRAVAFELLANDYLANPDGHPNALEAEKARFAEQQANWFLQLDEEDPGLRNKWMDSDFDDANWGTFDLPVSADNNPIGAPVASVWFRKQVTIPSQWVGKDLEISLGVIDSADETFVNGTHVGKTWFDTKEYWKVSRKYSISAADVSTTKLLVAMRLLKVAYAMAPFGPADQMYVTLKGDAAAEHVSLTGAWRSKKAKALDPGIEPRIAEMNKARPGGHYGQPGVMHNGMINPIAPYAIRGVVWSHGGANAPMYTDYRSLLPGLISGWRQEWGQGDFPFCVVQQSDCYEQQTAPVERAAWVNLRQAQMSALTLPNTFVVPTIGCGDSDNVHYKNKQEAGRRIMLAAMGEVYGKKDRTWMSPMYKSMKVEGNKIRLTFNFGRGMHSRGDPPVGFVVAGADRTFYFGQAKIEGDEVVVWSDKVPNPVAVRYAWAINPVCNVYNDQDLPILPFTTDSWDVSQIGIGKDTITIPSGWKPN